MDCQLSRDRMSWVLDGLLTVEEQRQLEDHLRQCLACRAEWQLMKAIHKGLRQTRPAPLPYDLTPIIMERIRAKERERDAAYQPTWTLRKWLAAAVVPLFLAFCLVTGLFFRQEDAPREEDYVTAHITRTISETGSPDLSPVSIALLGAYYASDDQ
ncbi:MAG: zf-HC2 domain-containing protein [Armatimonadetes bacterium]|nr:zf-HC2 domain-containing protein [Armatimonadota bacterium]MDW8121005.1 zf-HC2 domain-containing protein [Armatimonadota bacterium]